MQLFGHVGQDSIELRSDKVDALDLLAKRLDLELNYERADVAYTLPIRRVQRGDLFDDDLLHLWRGCRLHILFNICA